MRMKTMDLFLGGDIGLWVLEQIQKEHIATVFTTTELITQAAIQLGLNVIIDNPNGINYEAAQIAFSVHYNRILSQHVLEKYQKAYNLHPGYLPWGRGYYPIFWALWEKTPAGATLHEMAEKVDTGPIVAQTQVTFAEYETGHAVFLRVREAEKALFKEYHGKILAREEIESFPQPAGGTFHTKKEFMELKQPQDWRSMDADSLVRLTRYLTFPDCTGLMISTDEETFEMSLQPKELS